MPQNIAALSQFFAHRLLSVLSNQLETQSFYDSTLKSLATSCGDWGA